MPHQTSDSQRLKMNKTLLAIEVTVVLAIILIAGVLVVLFEQNKQQPSPTPTVVTLVDGNLTINAASYKYYNFTVEGTLTSDVQGTFTVSNGEKIRVCVMDNANFTQWQSTHNASTYYDSGAVDSANVTARVPAGGTYVLVYDNTLSSTPKNVTTNIYYDWL